MSIAIKWSGTRIIFFTILAGALLTPSVSRAQLKQPLLSEDNLKRVSDHVYVIEGFPNVAIIVGSRATLVVDTGLGQKQRRDRHARRTKAGEGHRFCISRQLTSIPSTLRASRHFPASTIIIRNSAQQDEMNKGVAGHIEVFKKMSAQNLDLLQDVKFRSPDVVFDREAKVDLGGVTARLFWLGPAHTKGDELTFVEEDSVLIPGDIVQKDIFPIMPNPDASVKGWLSILDKVEALHPKFIVPDHGPAIVDASQIATDRAYLMALQSRALELKKQGASVDDAGKTVTAELKAKYPDWPNPNNVAGEVARVYEQSQ